jgi:hypothetical protein
MNNKTLSKPQNNSLFCRTSDSFVRQRGGGGRGRVRLRVGRGLHRGVLLAATNRFPAKRKTLHSQAKQSLQSYTGNFFLNIVFGFLNLSVLLPLWF